MSTTSLTAAHSDPHEAAAKRIALVTAREELAALIEQLSIRRLSVVLSNGSKSDFYVDCKPVTLSGKGMPLVGQAFLTELEKLDRWPTAVGGLANGANPIVSAIVSAAPAEKPVDGFFVRQQPKPHGLMRLIENPPAEGASVVLVDDVVTSGSSVLKAFAAVREAGYSVIGAIALVDREEGGAERIRQAVGHYSAIFTKSQFTAAA